MSCTRSSCDKEGNEHALVPPIIEVRDNLGVLAVQVLAAKCDLAKMDYGEMIQELYTKTESLHAAYGKERTRISY